MSDTLQSDWQWIIDVTKMVEDRVRDGERVKIRRAPWISKNADPRPLMLRGMYRQLETILSTAEVIEPEETDGGS